VNSGEVLKAELAKALAECERLRKENARLRLRIGEDLEGDLQDVERPSLNRDVKAHPSAAVHLLEDMSRDRRACLP
jgi:regulator of replication initiation timing